jgi:adenylyl-sulfate kinase
MNNGFTLWFTGLPCSGKTTVAEIVAPAIRARGLNVEVLDGDVVRQGLSKELGFSKRDRDIHIRRIGFVSKLLSRNGVAVIASFVSPYRVIRDELRQEIGNFVEVYVKCPVEVCIERDVKGMYKKALAGEIENFTGISDPYEEPENPEIVIETDKEPPEESAQKVMSTLEKLGYVPKLEDVIYSEEEEEKIKKRLKALGYI